MAKKAMFHDVETIRKQRRARRTFDPNAVYMHDDGRVACGAHVGVEATYAPQTWRRIGNQPAVEHHGFTLVCETCHPNRLVVRPR